MAYELSEDETLLWRTYSQLLTPDTAVKSVLDVVRHMVGLQAQYPQAALLGVRVRSVGLTAADVIRARESERSIVRTWCMRGTLHLIPAEDVGWLTNLLGPGLIRGRKRRYRELGIEGSTGRKAIRVIEKALVDGPLTRAELGEALARSGLGIDVTGQALPHLIGRAALEGILCHGPLRGSEETFVRLDDWVGRTKSPPREESLAELALRYIRAYGPATPEDFAAWAGLTLLDARIGWKLLVSDIAEIRTGRTTAWVSTHRAPGTAATSGHLRLLPAFDAFLLGYRNRDLFLPAAFAEKVQAGGGIIHPTILHHGRIIGTWRYERAGKEPALRVDTFQPFPDALQPALREETNDIGRFLNEHPALEMPA